MLHSKLSRDLREITGDGVELTSFLFYVIHNPKFNGWDEIITDPYTQTHRLWSIKHLIWRGADIPWEHITAEDIEEYYRPARRKRSAKNWNAAAPSAKPPPSSPLSKRRKS